MKLIEYTPEYAALVDGYQLTEDQLRFCAHPKAALKLAAEDASRHPILAIEEDQLMSFFVLQEGVAGEALPGSCDLLLRSMSTDTRMLGKGYAKAAFTQLGELLRARYPQYSAVVLEVSIHNLPAQALYAKAGFVDTGARTDGRGGQHVVLRMEIKQ